jgi:hypothetical protein
MACFPTEFGDMSLQMVLRDSQGVAFVFGFTAFFV